MADPHRTGVMTLASFELGIQCPRATTFPLDPMHALSVRHHDIAYDAAPRDAEGEMADGPAADVVHAMADNQGASMQMTLYREATVVLMPVRQEVVVESWYWKCHICGLILSAQPVREAAGQ